MNNNRTISHLKPTKFNCRLVDWSNFQKQILSKNLNILQSNNINKESASITKIFRSAANASIPIINPKRRSKNVPWWSPKLKYLREEKQFAWRTYCLTNLIEYKKKNAIFNREKKVQ